MEDWYNYISNKILPLINKDAFWKNYLSEILSEKRSSVGIHLGVFVEPYLSYIIDGKKTVESRFGIKKQPPYNRVSPNDIVLLKHSGGPVIGLCMISDVWFYQLDKESWGTLRKEFSIALCAQDPEFWQQRKHASFATLMQIESVIQFSPVNFSKADRRGWVVLRPSRIGTDQ